MAQGREMQMARSSLCDSKKRFSFRLEDEFILSRFYDKK